MVGAGALGCEYSKQLALLGACYKNKGGKLLIADYDGVELSNLNR